MKKSIFVVALALVGFCVQAHADNGGNDVAAQFIIQTVELSIRLQQMQQRTRL